MLPEDLVKLLGCLYAIDVKIKDVAEGIVYFVVRVCLHVTNYSDQFCR